MGKVEEVAKYLPIHYYYQMRQRNLSSSYQKGVQDLPKGFHQTLKTFAQVHPCPLVAAVVVVVIVYCQEAEGEVVSL